MQKFLNRPDAFVDEMLEGLMLANPTRVRQLAEDPRAVVSVHDGAVNRVTIATGGGSGHLPLFVGYVRAGLIDGCAVGNLFASPSSDTMLAVTRAIHAGRGVLYIYGNYGGDRMNFEAAADLAREEGIEVRTLRGADDVASAPKERIAQRRGVAGIVFGYKVAAAAAHAGHDLAEVERLAGLALSNTRSMGVALAPCTLPTVGKPGFTVEPGEMEIGMGIHGERGVRRGPLLPADTIADDLVDRILADLAPSRGTEIAVLVNGLGSTPAEELYILYRRAHRRFIDAGLEIRRTYVGEYATSLEMAGASVSVMQLWPGALDLLDAATRTAGM
jgi:phosphoenolpyruvate---glycerone phosphotransferase subunit DhaK